MTATRAIVVSCDSHVGPLLDEQLRPYCPASHLDEYDDFVAWSLEERRQAVGTHIADPAAAPRSDDGNEAPTHAGNRNLLTDGHHDVHASLRDMDRDGVAAEVIYHFSTNGEPFPFARNYGGPLIMGPDVEDRRSLELAAVGYHIYNQWLADFCSVEPERHIGLAYLPMWDIDAATREAEWAGRAGLRGINFPQVGRPGQVPYNHPDWEPFWTVCETYGLSLNTHSGVGAPIDYQAGPGATLLISYEGAGWLARRAMWWLIFGGVFERHPGVHLVITEQLEGWWAPTMRELDSVARLFTGVQLDSSPLPRPPSEYMMSNVFQGASFMSTLQAEEASREGYATNVIWGRDYPHPEGTYLYTEDLDEEPITRASLRYLFSHVPQHDALLMAGENAVRAFGLDAVKLRGVAERIGALTPDELTTAPDVLPKVPAVCSAFRGMAGLT